MVEAHLDGVGSSAATEGVAHEADHPPAVEAAQRMLGYLWGGGESLAAALGDVGRWRGHTPGTECVQGRPERGTSVSGVVLVSLEYY